MKKSSQEKELNHNLPDTGISGVYEVMVAVDNVTYALKYFEAFGFRVVEESTLDKEDVKELYGISSGLTSIRLQNGSIDSHGLIRILKWEHPIGEGVGYAPPETMGQRMSVMMTQDIYRIHDIYEGARNSGEKWLTTEPVADDLFDLDTDQKGFFKRPVIVRENAVYGSFFNHIFFQRYGYKIPGYGSIGEHSPLQTSEFTHHDFIIKAPSMATISYLSSALGLKAEEEPVLDGDWQNGPKVVFDMKPGESHWYQGFVSPNNICGKLKFIIPTAVKLDRTDKQKIGHLGITIHSFYTDKLDYVYTLVKSHDLQPTNILKNEFGEDCFLFTGAAGCSWQIIAKATVDNSPTTELKFELTNN